MSLWHWRLIFLQDSDESTPFLSFLKSGARVTRAAHILLNGIAKPGDFVVDATCGNGIDTLWLCQAVGPTGKVLAFDLQVTPLRDCGAFENMHALNCAQLWKFLMWQNQIQPRSAEAKV